MTPDHVDEHANLTAALVNGAVFDDRFRQMLEVGRRPLADILEECATTLIFSREHEHAVGVMTSEAGALNVSYLSLPHPSGIAVLADRVLVLSTRTPHLLVEMEFLSEPGGGGAPTYLIPRFLRVLPGAYYGHEMLAREGRVVFNATGLNEIYSLPLDLRGAPSLEYRPAFIHGRRDNCMQLNSLAYDREGVGYSTCFSAVDSDYRPWKDEYGPLGRGALIRHIDSVSIVNGLTCPHSVRSVRDELLFCNSGFGELNRVPSTGGPSAVISTLPGFTRGLALSGDYAFVGLSRVQADRRHYAPGISPEDSLCGIAAVDLRSGETLSTLWWPHGRQIFDIQLTPSHKHANLQFPQSRLTANDPPSDPFFRAWE